MKPLFLEQMELSNFRVFGDSFILVFPKGPGVTLITGPNGVGKTTLFDGVEWCLTGNVSRFEGYMPSARRRHIDHLTRLGAAEGSRRVSLSFTEGDPIDRGFEYGLEPAKISNFLKTAAWPDIGDLYSYLSITHFLGQSAAQRFSVKKPKEQWEALKGPAGVDRINYTKDRIGGQAARQAFTRALQAAAAAIDKARANLADWDRLVIERDRARRLSASAEALPPDKIVQVVRELAEQLFDIDGTGSAPKLDGQPAEMLERLANLIEAMRQKLSEKTTQLKATHNIPIEMDRSLQDAETTTLMAKSAEERRKSISDEILSKSQELARMDADLEASRRGAAQADTRVQMISRVIETANVYLSTSNSLKRIDQDVATRDGKLREIEDRKSDAAAELAKLQAGLQRRHELSITLESAKIQLQVADHFKKKTDEISARLAKRDPRTWAQQLRRDIEFESEQLKAASLSVASIETQLRDIDDRVTAITAAAATIANRLAVEDTRCPVCHSSFAPGELKSIAEKISWSVPTSLDFARALAEAQARRGEIQNRLASLKVTLESAEDESRILEVAQIELRRLRSQLLSPELTLPADIIAASHLRLTKLEEEIAFDR
jgi:DNA repair exonuclease SbcCD ATPase subunit